MSDGPLATVTGRSGAYVLLDARAPSTPTCSPTSSSARILFLDGSCSSLMLSFDGRMTRSWRRRGLDKEDDLLLLLFSKGNGDAGDRLLLLLFSNGNGDARDGLLLIDPLP